MTSGYSAQYQCALNRPRRSAKAWSLRVMGGAAKPHIRWRSVIRRCPRSLVCINRRSASLLRYRIELGTRRMIGRNRSRIITHFPRETMGSKPAPRCLAQPRGYGTDHGEIVRATAPPCRPSRPAACVQLRVKAPCLGLMIQNEKFRLGEDKARDTQPCEL